MKTNKKEIIKSGLIGLGVSVLSFILFLIIGYSPFSSDDIIGKLYDYTIGLPIFTVGKIFECAPVDGYTNWGCMGGMLLLGFFSYIPIAIVVYLLYKKIKK